MKFEPNSKNITVVFRWLVILVLFGFLLFSPERYAQGRFWVLVSLLLAYTASNVWLSFLGMRRFEKYRIGKFIFFVDIALTSVILYLIKGLETDLYMVYFLIIFIAALQHGGIRLSWVTGLVTAAVYLGLYLRNNALESLLSSFILLRIPFFFLVAVFSAYHSEQLRMEIGRRKEAEETSGQMLQQYKMLVDTIPDIMYELDAEGRFTFVSQAARLAGYDPDELLGSHFSLLIHPEDIENVSRKIVLEKYKGQVTGDRHSPKLFDERRTEDRMTKNLTLRMLVKTPADIAGPFIYAEIHSSGKWSKDKDTGDKILTGSIGIIRDVSENYLIKQAVEQKNRELEAINRDLKVREAELERMLQEVRKSHEELKQAQAQLLQSEKLASIGQLAAGIAHEVNNPLGFLSSNIAALGKDLGTLKALLRKIPALEAALDQEDVPQVGAVARQMTNLGQSMDIPFFLEDVDRLYQSSMNGVERIKKIMTELKTFSRKDKGERVPSNINDVIDGVINIVWNEIKYRAELKKEYGQVPVVSCNPQQISQVILNLLLNAVQALEKKGTITVRTYPRDRGVCIEVQDNGKGIPEALLDNIFEPFFTTKEAGKGTGLGLSISADIVQRHKGKIEVSSQENKGTTFTVWLPL